MFHSALLVAVLLQAPQAASSPAAGPRLAGPFTQFTLQNGLHVILHEDHTVPLLTVNVWYDVGSARENPGRTGFAHLFEHLMFMGSGAREVRSVRSAARIGGRHQQRVDRGRPDELLHRRPVERPRPRAVPR